MTKEAFIGMVRRHDLTFMYSDDAYVRSLGWDNLERIRTAAKEFDRDFVVETWNSNVDSLIKDPYRKDFYWKD